MKKFKEEKLSDKIFLYSDVLLDNDDVLSIINKVNDQIWIYNDTSDLFNKFNVFSYADCYIGHPLKNNMTDIELLQRRMLFSFISIIKKYSEINKFYYTGTAKTFFLKYVIDNFDQPHYDSIDIKDSISLYYFINSDYEGGEIYFPNQDLLIKGKAGQLLVFPSTEKFLNFSKPVLSGTKYMNHIVIG